MRDMKTRTIAHATARRLLERVGSSLNALRGKGEIKISARVFLAVHRQGDNWIYLLRSEPEIKTAAPRLHPGFRWIGSLVDLSAA